MAKRGRPPHPDLLTPREWEVLALLRDGLSNDDIAQRLGITLAGAKYHVSEILSKLGASSREEAARWEPAGRPWWAMAFAPFAFVRRARWLATVAVGIAAVLVIAGIAILVWALVRTNDDGGATSIAPNTGTPASAITVPPERLTFARNEEIDVAPGVFFVDPSTGQTEGWSVLPAAVSDDGRYIVYREQGIVRGSEPSALLLFDTRAESICALPHDVQPAITFSPDGATFLHEGGAGVISRPTRCDAASRAVGLPADTKLLQAHWSPDSSMVLLRVQGVGPTPQNFKEPPRGLFLLDVAAGDVSQVATQEVALYANVAVARWSSDSSRFAVAAGNELSVFDREGRFVWSREFPVAALRNPRWSPSNENISMHADVIPETGGDRKYAVYVVGSSGGDTIRTLADSTACWGEVWTADSSRIVVWTYGQDFAHRAYDVVGNGATVVGDAAFFVEPSPVDANLVAFLGREERPEGVVGPVAGPITVAHVDGSEDTPLQSFSERTLPEWDPNHDFLPRWLEDGRMVIWTGGGGHGGCIAP